MSLCPSGVPAAQPAAAFQDDVRRLIAAMALCLRDTVAAFEDTVARITEMSVLLHGRNEVLDLVVALQDFARLQQEFATLSDILLRLSAPADGAAPSSADLVPAIALASLRDRLASRLSANQDELELSPRPDDMEF
jgi:hypothetical protein